MLIDVTHKETVVDPRDASSYDLLIRAREKLGTLRFNKDSEIIDRELEKLVSSGQAKNKLVFTKAGFLVGNRATAPHVDILHIWKSANDVFPLPASQGNEFDLVAEMQLKFVGGLVRWRISLLDDTWLAYRRPSGKIHPITGKEITISEYWINNNYIPPVPVKKMRGFTMQDLKTRMEGHRV